MKEKSVIFVYTNSKKVELIKEYFVRIVENEKQVKEKIKNNCQTQIGKN